MKIIITRESETRWEMDAIDENGVEHNLMDLVPLLLKHKFEIESTFEALAIGQTITLDTNARAN